jgi:DNA-binding NarL/FixJ family response regulator
MRSIVVVDPYQIYLRGFSSILKNQFDLQFFDVFDNIPLGSIDLFIIGFCPDLFGSCIEVAEKCGSPLLAVLDHGCKPYFKDIVIKANPDSYLHRSAPRCIVIKAVNTTLNGERFFDKKILPWFLDAFNGETEKYDLTPQEITALQLVLQGLSNQEIAERLHIALPTVKFHLKNVFRKTDSGNRKQLIALFNSFFLQKV